MLQGKNVLLGVCGSIAAYKAALLCRSLVKKGANVKVLMTPSSVEFITPLTLSTLSKNPVYWQYANPKTGEWNNHVELAKWADFFLLAPATQNTLAKMANGICDNLLLATYFSMERKVYFAPAMDLDMYRHPANKANIQKLISYGNEFIPPGEGELASGLFGEGRMAEVEDIISFIETDNVGSWKGKQLLITAGPTYEAIDPVRFIGNHSSGKMGYAIAEEALRRGAGVTLIAGPNTIEAPKAVRLIKVRSAEEMFQAVSDNYREADVMVLSAAVADYTPATTADQKIKKSEEQLELKLKPTKDIIKWLGKEKKKKQFLVGFALETQNEEANAIRKLEEKNCDLLVLNSLQNKGAGFGADTNQVTLFDRNNNKKVFELKSKKEVAKDILKAIEERW
jgi:phosphopantothenoylcysteine decarboxylase/phosphopantothenate--cysteine ligase